MANDISDKIGNKILKRRLELGYTQDFISKRLGIPQNSVSNIEKGKSGLSIGRLIHISEILKVDLNYFIQMDNIDQKNLRIQDLEKTIERLERRNEILELYIIENIEAKKNNSNEKLKD
jgi:transcriptional regulator with XRE-family HTH domain